MKKIILSCKIKLKMSSSKKSEGNVDRWYYEDGQISGEHDHNTHKHTYWNRNGKIASYIYTNKCRHFGTSEMWYENGQQYSINHFDEYGKFHGEWKTWNSKGRLISKKIYEHGICIDASYWEGKDEELSRKTIFHHESKSYIDEFYRNGKLYEKTCYDKTMTEHGTSFCYYQSGKIKSKITYYKGYRSGSAILYHENGQKSSVTPFNENDQISGIKTLWDENGRKEAEYEYLDGEILKRTEWHDGGNLVITEYEFNSIQGRWNTKSEITYDPNGEVIEDLSFGYNCYD